MDRDVLTDIQFRPDLDGLRKKLRVRDGGGWGERFARLVQEAEAIARPRALYGVAYVDSRSEGSVVVDGIEFHSRVLRVNLENSHRVFPFVVTCGTELHEFLIGRCLARQQQQASDTQAPP